MNKRNVENFVSLLIVLLGFIELSFTLSSFAGEANSNERSQGQSHGGKTKRFDEVVS